jgi:tRNA(Ile)-lysidine synthase TilS/MesJ
MKRERGKRVVIELPDVLREDLDKETISFIFPRRFFQTAFKKLLDDYFERRNAETPADKLLALYELVYGRREDWKDSVRKKYEIARAFLKGERVSIKEELAEKPQPEKKQEKKQEKEAEQAGENPPSPSPASQKQPSQDFLAELERLSGVWEK